MVNRRKYRLDVGTSVQLNEGYNHINFNCGFVLRNGEENDLPQIIVFLKRRQHYGCLRTFFISTGFCKILYQVIGYFAETC